MQIHLLSSLLFLALILAGCATTQPQSPYNLGVEAYRAEDYAEAARQWSIAVEGGDTTAMNNLAYLLNNSLGVKEDRARAITLWKAAATAGQSESQWHLGPAYQQGLGVDRDPVKAYAWVRCAIENAENKARGSTGDIEKSIAEDARKSLVEIADSLAPEDLGQVQSLAARYIASYAAKAP